MNLIPSNSSSSTNTGDNETIYTVREKEISRHAVEILSCVHGANLKEMNWTSLIQETGSVIYHLVVFQTGSSNGNRALDVLSGIREQIPRAQSIIAVIICTDNDPDHVMYCSSIEQHLYKMKQDISLEYHIFSDGRRHTCSDNIHEYIESQIKAEMQKEFHAELRAAEELVDQPEEAHEEPDIVKEIVRSSKEMKRKKPLTSSNSKTEREKKRTDELRKETHEKPGKVKETVDSSKEKKIKKPPTSKINETEMKKTRTFENGAEKNLRNKMKELTSKVDKSGKNKKDIDNLEETLKKFMFAKVKMTKISSKATQSDKTKNDLEDTDKLMQQYKNLYPDDEDVLEADRVLEKGRLELELNDAILRRRTEYLERAIEKTKESKFVDELQTLLSHAEKVLGKLNDLDDNKEINPQMIIELRGHQNPSKGIQDIMKAAFLLLEENPEDLEWRTIQKLMAQPQDVIKKITNFDEKKVDEKTLKKVINVHQTHSEDKVKKAGAAALAFYTWISKCLRSISQRNPSSY